MTAFAANHFCWTDLSTTNAAKAKGFYGELFGWKNVDMPMPEGGSYAMMQLRGQDVCGLGEQSPQEQKQGVPTHWNAYVAVKSVDEMLPKVTAAGGSILVPAFDVGPSGRMAFIADPTGASLGLWQAKNHKGAGLWGEPGATCWLELGTTNAKAASDFYTAVFGWKAQKSDSMGELPYTEFSGGKDSFAGMFEMTPEMKGMPPAWVPYFQVANIQESFARAQRLGASVFVPVKEIPRVGSFAMVSDPTGGAFCMIQMNAGM